MKKWEYWWVNTEEYRDDARKSIEQIVRDVKSSQIWTETDQAEKERLIQKMQREKPDITDADVKMYISNYWGDLGWELVAIDGSWFIFKRALEPEWEYMAGYLNKDFIKRYELETKFSGASTDFDALFNELGAEGWELASCSIDSSGKFVVFKRKYIEEEEELEEEADEDEDEEDEFEGE